MADNVPITAGTGTAIAADDISSVFYQRVKLSLGADGAAVDAVAGAGVVGTGVQRVTLASDDPAVASLAVMDDWDESDRAKVNPIVGQAGVAAGAGAVGATVQRFTAASDDPIVVKLASFSASATFTPAAASHVAGDCHGAAQEFTSMGNSAGRIMINSATLEIQGGTAEATAWRLALFNITPPSAVADDGAFTLPSGDRASFLGFIELGTAIDEVDTQWIETHGIQKQVKLAGTSLFAYLINRTTLTPANVAHIVTLHATAL